MTIHKMKSIKNKKDFMFIKYSPLIQIKFNRLSFTQRKIINFIINFIRESKIKRKQEGNIFSATANEIKQFCGIGRESNKFLKEEFKKIFKMQLEFNCFNKDKNFNENEIGRYISWLKSDNGFQTIIWESPNSLIEKIINPSMFSNLNMLSILNLTSKYSISLYELISDYSKISFPFIEIDSFKNFLGIDDKQYSEFKYFNDFVLKKIIKDINERTEYTIEPVFKTNGKKVLALSFRIKLKTKDIEKEETSKTTDSEEKTKPLQEEKKSPQPDQSGEEKKGLNKKFNFPLLLNEKQIDILSSFSRILGDKFKTDVIAVLRQEIIDGREVEIIKSNIEYCLKKNIKKDFAGYLFQSIKNDYAKAMRETVKEDSEKKENARKKAVSEAQKKKEQEEKEKKEIEDEENAALEWMNTLSEEEIEKLKKELDNMRLPFTRLEARIRYYWRENIREKK